MKDSIKTYPAHPEQRPGELYLGLASPEDVWSTTWLSSRWGKLRTPTEDVPLLDPTCRPWFISLAEVRDAIAAERLAARPWSPEKILVYEQLLAQGNNQNELLPKEQ